MKLIPRPILKDAKVVPEVVKVPEALGLEVKIKVLEVLGLEATKNKTIIMVSLHYIHFDYNSYLTFMLVASAFCLIKKQIL